MKKICVFLLLFCLSTLYLKANEIPIQVQVKNSSMAPKLTYEVLYGKEKSGPPIVCTYFREFSPNKKFTFHSSSPASEHSVFCGSGEFATEEEGEFRLFVPLQICLPGQRLDMSLQAVDDEERVDYSFVPNPLIAKSKTDFASFSADLIAVGGSLYTLNFKDFNKNEKLMFVSESSGEKIEHEINSSQYACISYSPEVVGLSGGLSKVSVKRKNGEILSLNLMWGEEFNDYIRGKDTTGKKQKKYRRKNS